MKYLCIICLNCFDAVTLLILGNDFYSLFDWFLYAPDNSNVHLKGGDDDPIDHSIIMNR